MLEEKKRELLDKLIEHLSMMDDPLEKDPEDESEEEPEIEILKVEGKPQIPSNDRPQQEKDDEEEVFKKKLKRDMAMGC